MRGAKGGGLVVASSCCFPKIKGRAARLHSIASSPPNCILSPKIKLDILLPTAKMLYKSLLASAIAPLVLGMDYPVMVGEGGNVFNPSTITGAMMGDTVKFMFSGVSHSVVESSFDEPCEPMSGGFSVGVQSKSINFTVNVMDSSTHWFYCSMPGHCNSGMVGVINPP